MAAEFQFKTSPERSRLMKKIRLKNTQPEKLLRKELTRIGFRYGLNSPKLPDIVLNRYNLVIFVDGEFWHGFEWEKKKTRIKANREYWIPKIERTIARDKANNEKLGELGFVVLRFWANEIKNDLASCVKRIADHCVSGTISAMARKG